MIRYNYAQDLGTITEFINNFSLDPVSGPYYPPVLKSVSERQVDEVYIELDHVLLFNEQLCKDITKNAKRYRSLFYKAIDDLMPASETPVTDDASPLEVILELRRQRDAQRLEGNPFPPSLVRRYTLYFRPLSTEKQLSVRSVKPELLGNLVSVKGMVTRVSNVSPLAVVMALSCDKCGSEVFQEFNSFDVTPLSECPSAECKKNQSKGKLHLQTRACKFLKFQKVKIQELPDQVPVGHIPRTMTVHMLEHQTRKCSPGDNVVISGVFMPVPYTGFKALRAGLITDVILEAHHIQQAKKQYKELELTDEIRQQIEELGSDPNLYSRLARSIAPEIYGHDDIKKAMLLLLVGGTSRDVNGMKIRGDLNICLMGDPGVAKSQLLKHITKIAPRSIYTTGRGSSGVGLTASVVRDPVSNELVLEGGALVMADNGIACIDEFDKMDENDRTAIHEVMEQQTISISKAGITTTLNARTSILAAANPYYGRYDRRKKATENINLPAALLSRFDLLFLILDTPNPEDDLRLAQHVTHVHMFNRHPKPAADAEAIDPLVMRHYIALARNHSPQISRQVTDYMVNAYVKMRKEANETSDFQYTCARTLLSILRMASALARLRFSDVIDVQDAQEAMRLIDVSKSSLVEQKVGRVRDPISIIFEEIKSMSTKADGSMFKSISVNDIKERIIRKGFSEQQLTETLDIYEHNAIWMRMNNGSRIQWMDINEYESD